MHVGQRTCNSHFVEHSMHVLLAKNSILWQFFIVHFPLFLNRLHVIITLYDAMGSNYESPVNNNIINLVMKVHESFELLMKGTYSVSRLSRLPIQILCARIETPPLGVGGGTGISSPSLGLSVDSSSGGECSREPSDEDPPTDSAPDPGSTLAPFFSRSSCLSLIFCQPTQIENCITM